MKRFKNIFPVILVFVVIAVFYGYWYLNIKDPLMVMDERFHYPQIIQLTHFDFTPSKSLGMGPGYHLVMSFLLMVFKPDSIHKVRLISLILNLSAVAIFYITALKIDKKGAILKTLLFGFFAVNSIHFLFIYTDIFSTLLVLLSLYLVLIKKYTLAGLVGFFSLIVRQMNIFFLALIFAISYLQEYGFNFSLRTIIKHLKKTPLFVIGIIAFGVYYKINPNITLGSEAQWYLTPRLSFGNVYFSLFLYFYLFLPENIAQIGKIINLIKKRYIFLILGTILLFFFYLYTFVNNHPWNITPHLLRNIPMIIFTADIRGKITFFVVMLFSILFLLVARLQRKEFYLLYPVSLFMLMWVWLVEPRYYMIPYCLFILFKKVEFEKMTVLTILLNAVISSYLIYGTFNLLFFP